MPYRVTLFEHFWITTGMEYFVFVYSESVIDNWEAVH